MLSARLSGAHELHDLNVLLYQLSIFVVGAGRFGGPRSSEVIVPTKTNPDRKPDKIREFKTNIDQVKYTMVNSHVNGVALFIGMQMTKLRSNLH